MFEKPFSDESLKETNEIVVDFFRHGDTEYTGMPADLTDVGRERVQRQADLLAETLDIENELVVVWKSPASRTKETARIIKETLVRKGANVLDFDDESHTVTSLQDRGRTFSRSLDAFKKLFPNDSPEDIETKLNLLTTDVRGFDESDMDVNARFHRVLEYIYRAGTHVHPIGGKKLHFVLVGHGTAPPEILNKAGLLETEEKFPLAGNMRLVLDGSSDKIRVNYNNKTSTVSFDRTTRELS